MNIQKAKLLCASMNDAFTRHDGCMNKDTARTYDAIGQAKKRELLNAGYKLVWSKRGLAEIQPPTEEPTDG